VTAISHGRAFGHSVSPVAADALVDFWLGRPGQTGV